ncbi:MAG: S24 family peptidase [Stenotrophomonas sp.]
MERLYAAIKLSQNGRPITQAELARALNTSSQRIKNWETRGISQQGANEAQEELGVSSSHVLNGSSPVMLNGQMLVSPPATRSDYVHVQQLDAEAEMGEGTINDDYPEVIRAMDFTQAYIRSLVGFVPAPGRLVLVTGRGDSMIPIIQPGESLMVDTGVTAFDGDGIYLINTGNGQQVKGLQDRGDAVYVVSANAVLYPAFPLPRGTLIGGKVYLRNRIERFN